MLLVTGPVPQMTTHITHMREEKSDPIGLLILSLYVWLSANLYIHHKYKKDLKVCGRECVSVRHTGHHPILDHFFFH